ncbi:hypothetical protein SEMRO_506_G156311.1 [Seminavis robusta]|uniref:Uncharacterized protein n=1 Tax=Seminavis robusta TaxID=568900 RepID=A0A9N8HIK3_9STRA|nr:hypothetical protein SEMRO_506_G156311.1 [Seminavis robusta]|eukprot:Sro506_g156311.1  (194) ;mRNA; f:26934-27515
MGALSSKWQFESIPEGIDSVIPIWSPPPSSGNVEFALSKYVKEYIATTLHTCAQGYSLAVDTSGRKLILKSGENTLAMAKRFGESFRIFRLHPNYEGQQPCGKLRRANNAPLYFHSSVKRQHKIHYGKKRGIPVFSGWESMRCIELNREPKTLLRKLALIPNQERSWPSGSTTESKTMLKSFGMQNPQLRTLV